MEQRKISDVVLDLESKVRSLGGFTQNIDNNVKLILDKLNRLSSQLENLKGISASPASSVVPPQSRLKLSVDIPDDTLVAQPLYESSLSDDVSSSDNELTEEVVHKGQRRGLRNPGDPSNTSKVVVSQQILFPDGKAIFLANVEIMNTQGLLIKETRTNPKGRWMAALDPGEYTVHVLKRDNAKLPVELRYKIRIPQSKEPLALPTPELPDVYRN